MMLSTLMLVIILRVSGHFKCGELFFQFIFDILWSSPCITLKLTQGAGQGMGIMYSGARLIHTANASKNRANLSEPILH